MSVLANASMLPALSAHALPVHVSVYSVSADTAGAGRGE